MDVESGFRTALIANIDHGQQGDVIDEEAEYDSPETVDAIAASLEKNGLDVRIIEAGPDLAERLKAEEIGFAFNIAEGRGGRDREAQVPALLSLLDIPYSGSDALVMAVTLDKAMCKRFAASYGIRTATFALLHPGDEEHLPELEYPVFVKPNAEGSGKGVTGHCIAEDPRELKEMLSGLFSDYHQDMLVETFLPGREFTVGLLGNGDDLRVFPPMEVVYEHPTQGEYCVYSYEIKKDFRKHVHYVCPAHISEEAASEMTEAAKMIFEGLGCRDLSRADFRMDEDGRPYFLESNPLPGLSPGYSDYIIAADAIGYSYDEIIGAVANAALKRVSDPNGMKAGDLR